VFRELRRCRIIAKHTKGAIKNIEVGSGTVVTVVVPVSENVALNGPSCVTSVPTRDQSGARSPRKPFERIQVSRSSAKGVEGATIGMGAESHRKSHPKTRCLTQPSARNWA
jgi:hypothetical protein